MGHWGYFRILSQCKNKQKYRNFEYKNTAIKGE